MRVLVTGGAGFIGSHLCEHLIREGHEVVCLDDLSTGSLNNLHSVQANSGFTFIKGDASGTPLDDAFDSDLDVVFHLAATVGVRRVVEKAERVIKDGVAIPHILDLARRYDVDRVMYASSSEVYGNQQRHPLTEDGPVMPHIPYAATKLFGEYALSCYHEQHGLATTAMRYFNVYGPRQDGSDYGFVVGVFLNQVLSGQPLTIHGDGSQTRDFTFVHDNVKAMVSLLGSPSASGQTVNVGTGVMTSVLELAEAVLEAHGSGTLIHTPARQNDVLMRQASTTHLASLIGNIPQTPLRDGLRQTLNSMHEDK